MYSYSYILMQTGDCWYASSHCTWLTESKWICVRASINDYLYNWVSLLILRVVTISQRYFFSNQLLKEPTRLFIYHHLESWTFMTFLPGKYQKSQLRDLLIKKMCWFWWCYPDLETTRSSRRTLCISRNTCLNSENDQELVWIWGRG